jgi:short-subunit dehydrogenase
MTVAYDLSNKTAVVTGGAKGIGRAIAEPSHVPGRGFGLGHFPVRSG